MANKKEKQPWTIYKTASTAFVVSTAVFLIGWILEPSKTAGTTTAGFWLLQNVAPIVVTILISFFALGWRRPARMQALNGAAMGAVAGSVIGYITGFLLIFLPGLNIFISYLVGRAASSYLSAAGTLLGELKEEKK